VETELELKPRKGERIPALLCSRPITSTTRNGALLYQTAIMDLTDRKRAEEALRAKEAELEAIINRTPFMLTRCTRDLRYRFVSRAYAEMLGRTPEEIAGQPIVEIMGEEGLKTVSPHIEKVLKGQRAEYEMEGSFQGVGAPCLHCVYTPDRDASGNVIGWFASLTDVTERKRAENALRVSRQRLLATYERAPIGIIECSLKGKYVGANEEFCRILGYRKEELLQRGIKDVTPKEDYSREIKLHRQLVAGEIPFYDIEKRFVRKDGAIIWAQILRSLVRDAEGTPIYTIGAARDITEHKAAEEKLTWLAAYPRDNPDPVVEFDLETNAIYYANPATLELFPDLQRLGLRHPFVVRVMQAAKPLLEGRTKAVYADINVGNSCYAATAVRIPKTRRLRVYSSDISERKRAESALQESKRLLEVRVRERTHELDAANTELRNEIQRRKGLEGEILAVSDREQQRLGQELHDGVCQHLTAVAFMAHSVALRLKNHRVIDAADIEKIAQLVNQGATDMRNLSRALHRSDVDAPKLTGALQDLVDREIWRVSCRLEVKSSFQIEDDMVAAQLYRIAREAVINANKHSQAREIVVRLERSPEGMVLRVTDDGVGFSNGTELRQGLGFHIMNYRAQVMGGRLEIESPKRGGTRVSCYLPNKALQSRKKENADSGLPGKIANALAALI
jgi:PAS domain S-box-containing protein